MRLFPRQAALFLLAALVSAAVCLAQDANSVAPPQTSPPHVSPTHVSPKSSTKARVKKRVRRRRKITKTSADDKVLVRHGGTTEALPQMAPVAPKPQESLERRKSGQLLTSTQANIKNLDDKKLTTEQRGTLTQIHLFMEQSRAALDAGDLTQGYNLALKANVLSEELIKK